MRTRHKRHLKAARGDGTVGLNGVLPSSCARHNAIAGDTYVWTRKASCPSHFDRRNPMRGPWASGTPAGSVDLGRCRPVFAHHDLTIESPSADSSAHPLLRQASHANSLLKRCPDCPILRVHHGQFQERGSGPSSGARISGSWGVRDGF